MARCFVSIWFRHLLTDYFSLRDPQLRTRPFVLTAPVQNRIVITAANALAELQGVYTGMALADARAAIPSLAYQDEPPGLSEKLLLRIAAWCIRFTPVAAVDPPAGIMLDATGCSHLWGGDTFYMTAIAQKCKAKGYDVRGAMAGTIGTSWALARYGTAALLAENGKELSALLPLPPAALRIEAEAQDALYKLGLHQVGQFISLPRESLRRRFGAGFLLRLDQALGNVEEFLKPVCPPVPYTERLPCLEPISTRTGIEIALQRLLETLCGRLSREGKGLRTAAFSGFRIDGKKQVIQIQTRHPSHHAAHLEKLFEHKLAGLEPGPGIELFTLEAGTVEEHTPAQSALWSTGLGFDDIRLAELIDHLSLRLGEGAVQRYQPAEHHWPERSVARRVSVMQTEGGQWPQHSLRPLWLIRPEPIQVTAPVPDYPPMNFRYKGKLHTVKKADGPERIEPEWWRQSGEHRDYYIVEDQDASRYWIFRLGHYDAKRPVAWFLHGFFA